MQELQTLSLFSLNELQPHNWRFIFNEPKTLDDEPLVIFVGYNLANEVVAYWDSSLIAGMNYIYLAEPETPTSVELGCPLVEDPDMDNEDDDNSEAVNN